MLRRKMTANHQALSFKQALSQGGKDQKDKFLIQHQWHLGIFKGIDLMSDTEVSEEKEEENENRYFSV